MSFDYDYGLKWLAEHNMATVDYRAALVCADSTAGSERSVQFMDEFSDLDEYDDASYARKDLAGVTGSLDMTGHYYKVTATAPVWATLDASPTDCIAMILFAHVTDDTDSVPIRYVNDSPTFPFNGIGDSVTISPNGTTGMFRMAN